MANVIFWNCFNGPANPSRPMGAHAMAHWIQQHGYTSKVIDFCHGMTTDQLVNLTEKHIDADTIAIGANTTFWIPSVQVNQMHRDEKIHSKRINYAEPVWAIDAREIVQARHPKIKWVLGGANSWRMNSYYDWDRFYGNSENQFLKYLDEHSSKTITRKEYDIKTAQGVWYQDNLSLQPGEFLTIEMGRGCHFKCRFCSYPLIGKKKGTYLRDISLVEQEFKLNYERYGITNYSIVDDTVNESAEKIEQLAEVVQKLPFKLNWIGFNRIDLIATQPHTIDLLRASGLRGTLFGMESLHPGAAQAVGKGWNAKHSHEFYPRLMEQWQNDVSVTMSWIVGLPGENAESLDQTQQWCLDNRVHFWYYNPLWISRNFTGSEFSRNHAKYGYSFPKPLDDMYWESDLWNVNTAKEKCIQLNYDQRRFDTIRTHMWEFPKHSALGWTVDELINATYPTLYDEKENDSPEVFRRFRKFVSDYYNSQINL